MQNHPYPSSALTPWLVLLFQTRYGTQFGTKLECKLKAKTVVANFTK